MRYTPLVRSRDAPQGVTVTAPAGQMDFSGFVPEVNPENLESANWISYRAGPSAYTLAALEADLNRELTPRDFFLPRTTYSGQLTFVQDTAPTIASTKKLLVSWDNPRDEPGLSHAAIANGDFDTEIAQIAQVLIDNGHGDAELRFNHEADTAKRVTRSFRQEGDGTSAENTWSNPDQGVEFRAAWQQVHSVVMNLTGAAFTWQYGVDGPGGLPPELGGPNTEVDPELGEVSLLRIGYAGDAVVDLVGVGAYDRGQYRLCDDPSWGSSHTKNKLDYVSTFATDRGKKFSTFETGCVYSSDGSNSTCPSLTGNGCGDDPDFWENLVFYMRDLGSSRGHLQYFNHPTNDLDCFPNTKQKFIDLFGV